MAFEIPSILMLLADANMETVMDIRFCVATLQSRCLRFKLDATYRLTRVQTIIDQSREISSEDQETHKRS
jgi:hypothetical protein